MASAAARSARAHAATKRSSGRELVCRAVREQPGSDVRVAVQLGQRVRRRAVGPPPRHIGAVLHEPFDHGDIPSSRRHVKRRLIVLAPGKVRVRAMLEQPVRARWISAHCIMCTSGGTPPGIPFTLTPYRFSRSSASTFPPPPAMCIETPSVGFAPASSTTSASGRCLIAQMAPQRAVRGSSGCQFQWYSAFGFAPRAQSRRAIATSPSTREGTLKCRHVWHT